MTDTGTRIIQLEAENFKRLRAVEITPDGDLVVIAGSNAAGKSSVLDAIAGALGGGNALKGQPEIIRQGQQEAHVRLDLGTLIVTRTWTADGKSKLTVTAADGAKYSSPQAILDKLIGSMSFDPLAFANMPAKAQRDTLLSLVELPWKLDEIDAKRAAIYEQRTDANRELKRVTTLLANTPTVEDAGGPSLAEALAAYRAADELAKSNAGVRSQCNEALRVGNAQAAVVDDLVRSLADAKVRLAQLTDTYDDLLERVDALPDDPDMTALDEAVKSAEARSAQAAKAEQRLQLEAEVMVAKETAATFDARLSKIDEIKAEGLRGAKMPIPELSVDVDGVTYQDVPFSQCSGAEQLRVSLAIAMAANPQLRVIRITDGSLLDADNLRLVGSMAAEHGYQVWIERVGTGDGIGVIIEDGAVAAVYSDGHSVANVVTVPAIPLDLAKPAGRPKGAVLTDQEVDLDDL